MISGSRARARARPTRFRMPPDSSAGFLSKNIFGQADLGEPGHDRLPDFLGGLVGVLPQGKGDVLGNRHAVEQGGLLEQETEAGPLPRQFPLAQLGQIVAIKMHLAAGRVQEPDDRLQQHSLAAAALADHGQRLALRDGEVDVAEHALPAEIDPNPIEFGPGRGSGSAFSREAVTMVVKTVWALRATG